MAWKPFVVVPLLAAVLCWAAGCGSTQKEKTVHGTQEAFKRAEQAKGK